jgi:hypothetical protein
MFDNFEKAFIPDSKMFGTEIISSAALFTDDQVRELFTQYGGDSFNQGLYRIISYKSVTYWNGIVLSGFPSFSGRITCFGIDWLGRVFALDTERLEDGRPSVVMFEPGTAEVLELPCNIESFHESELIQYQEEALAQGFHQRWLESGGVPPEITQCIGYMKPLFLGGSDKVENLEVSDLDVYWTTTVQLIQKTRGLLLGTSIDKVSIT